MVQVGSDQWMRTTKSKKVDVISNEHNIPNSTLFMVEGSGGIRDNQRADTQQPKQPDRICRLVQRMTLIVMKSADHAHNLHISKNAENELTEVSLYGGLWKVRNIVVIQRNDRFVTWNRCQAVDETTKATSTYNRNRRRPVFGQLLDNETLRFF